LALVPQATFLASPVAVAPPPLAVAGGTVAPVALPTQTNCACACGAPRQHASAIASAIASAEQTDETKDNRMQCMIGPPTEEERICESDNTRVLTVEDSAREFRLGCLIF
jgi:hypothetical protein